MFDSIASVSDTHTVTTSNTAAASTPEPIKSGSFFSDAEIISSYSIQEAIEDGVLVDLREKAPDVAAQHYGRDAVRRPVVCTIGVWDLIEKAINHPRHCNDLNGVVHDIMWMAKHAVVTTIARGESGALPFPVIITGTGRTRNHTLMAHIAVVRHAGQTFVGAVTFHLPDED
ncbi:MAG: DUF6573 family protein [Gemmatimonadaceae bacterium]